VSFRSDLCGALHSGSYPPPFGVECGPEIKEGFPLEASDKPKKEGLSKWSPFLKYPSREAGRMASFERWQANDWILG